MLQEKRFSIILNLLDKQKTVTIKELSLLIKTSESTIRRDLDKLDEMHKLSKVYGGAVSLKQRSFLKDLNIDERNNKNVEAKKMIAKYTSTLICDEDLVFIDSGSTSLQLVNALPSNLQATFVTNSILHAYELSKKHKKVIVIGGNLKNNTLANVGVEAIDDLHKYNFTKAFLGANAISLTGGYSTPNLDEANLKKKVIEKAKMTYILADNSKFGNTSKITFAKLAAACIITNNKAKIEYKKITKVIEVNK